MRFLAFILLALFFTSCSTDIRTTQINFGKRGERFGKRGVRNPPYRNQNANEQDSQEPQQSNHLKPVKSKEVKPVLEKAKPEIVKEVKPVVETKPVRTQPKVQPKPEGPFHFTIPVKVTQRDTNILIHSIKNRKEIIINTDPDNRVLTLRAGLEGVIKINDDVISIQSGNRRVNLQIDPELSQLIVKSGSRVRKLQKIGTTTGPVFVYLQNRNKLELICLKDNKQKLGNVEIIHTKDENPNDPCTNNRK